jgi:hypothetical protein
MPWIAMPRRPSYPPITVPISSDLLGDEEQIGVAFSFFWISPGCRRADAHLRNFPRVDRRAIVSGYWNSFMRISFMAGWADGRAAAHQFISMNGEQEIICAAAQTIIATRDP